MAFRSSSANFVTGTTNTVTKPAGVVDGDVLLAAWVADNLTVTMTPPAGWSQYGSNANIASGSNLGQVRLFYKVASGEGSNYAFTLNSSLENEVCIGAWSGRAAPSFSASNVAITVVATNNASPYALSSTGLTAGNGDDIAYFIGLRLNNNANAATLTAPTNYITRNNSSGAHYNDMCMCSRDNVSAGATGTLGGSIASTGNAMSSGVFVIALAAAGGGSTVVPRAQAHYRRRRAA